uniref:Uncharacterized protein n=1 Tax=Pseudomonas phage HRDY3 TaxID=3236930 RepID=A0AB39CE44_9VIRU
MNKPFNMMHFIHRIPWDDDHPHITNALNQLLVDGIDFAAGTTEVHLIRRDDYYDLDLVQEFPDTGRQTVTTRFLISEQRDAIQRFVAVCDEAQNAFEKTRPEQIVNDPISET